MYTPIFDIQVFAMPKLTDMQIRAWIKAGDRFDGKADGNGLYICYPKNYTVPLGGVKRVRVEFQNVGNFLLRKSVVIIYVRKMVNMSDHFQNITTAGETVAKVCSDTIRILFVDTLQSDSKLAF